MARGEVEGFSPHSSPERFIPQFPLPGLCTFSCRLQQCRQLQSPWPENRAINTTTNRGARSVVHHFSLSWMTLNCSWTHSWRTLCKSNTQRGHGAQTRMTPRTAVAVQTNFNNPQSESGLGVSITFSDNNLTSVITFWVNNCLPLPFLTPIKLVIALRLTTLI